MQFRNTKILDNGFKVDVLVVCCGFNLTYNIILECQNQYIYFNLFLFKSKKKNHHDTVSLWQTLSYIY